MTPRERWRAWWDARHPRRDTHLMGQNNVYILPSRPGLAFCLTLALLLLASINDQLSLGYMLSFLLAGAGLASMHSTHGNLRALSLDLKPPGAVFAGEELRLELRLHNSGRARFGIGVHAQGSPDAEIAWTDVPARGHAQLQLRLPAGARGLQTLPPLQIVTRFPLGLFRAWSIWRPAAQVWVYPRPETPAPPFPPQRADEDGRGEALVALRQQGQDFEGVRDYRRGDSMRLVLWKKAALSLQQGTPLSVRETQAPAARTLWLDWRDSGHGIASDEEARLSRLSAWVLAAEKLQAPYGLRLPAGEWPPALGPAQRQLCLEQLALHPGAAR
ncbi:DUF58 domain-containing protein [Roseateles violae]|uniref:DUF58 domain-containing protein n=1 Tax=Roseateles violae TaxID=3058042 RepID=A0ABT8DPG9_9BURK|nr:DUF58 domain-containing protein [Pelomonas sp. PFR6]MDN3920230.1 DUF58 domain-containing protein [Pelomonas sp. PFR6]